MKYRLIVAAAMTCAQPASAEWLKASTRHFVVYSDTDEAAISGLADRLEKVDGALRLMTGIPDSEEAAANPVTVYVLDDQAAVQRLSRSADVAGFYVPRADGAVAFTPRRGRGGGVGELDPETVLFHEYAHHFMLGNSNVAYPAWLTEGYAEFVSTARITPENVELGRVAMHRGYELYGTQDLPLSNLLQPPARTTDRQQALLYSRGWLLTHYLMMDKDRRAQLGKYVAAVNRGVPSLQAAADSFGEIKKLDWALDRYMKSPMYNYVIPTASLPRVPVAVRPLTPGERALIEMRMVSTRGVDSKTAGPLHARAVKAAAAHPGDPVAQGWLAEMAYDAERHDDAEAAADRALAADPNSVQALLYKARVHLHRARAAKAVDPKVWTEARSWIVKANRVNPDGAAALQLFYDSFRMAGQKPSASAVAGVHRALELAPQDRALRFRSARQHLADGRIEEAKRALRPLAYDPHASADGPAAKLLALLESGAAGQAAAEAASEKAEEGEGS